MIVIKVNGEIIPNSTFSIEDVPKTPGKCLVRFYENITGPVDTGFEWDEYHLELNKYPGIEHDIEANLSSFAAQAKIIERNCNIIPNLQFEQAQTKADIDYLAMMLEVEL